MNIVKNRNDMIVYSIAKNREHNLSICVQNGEVVVNAPWYLSRNEIQELVEQKRKWILEKIKEYEEARQGYAEGEMVFLLGERYQVKTRYRHIKAPELELEQKNIKITIPNKYKKVEKETILQVIIEKLYQVVAQREIEQAMEKMRLKLAMAPEDYEIKRLKKTLGKCTEDKKIILNPEIVKYPKEVIEYVVLHEFCHLKYKNHTKKFYEMIMCYMPDYEKYAKEINNLQY